MSFPDIFDVSKTEKTMSVIFNSTMKNVDQVCIKTMRFLSDKTHGIKGHFFAIHLVLREGLTNAVKHGNKGDPAKVIKYLIKIDSQETIHMEIEDQGKGFDWRKIEEKSPDDTDEHGRGLMIMKQYFSSYQYNEKGNRLILKKDILS
ncbi:MAG: ATP-binding protein [Thermodesulfobacteriota bacterium]|nr:ATP-binding protein [Thermodesulfobacteriota bacterium]